MITESPAILHEAWAASGIPGRIHELIETSAGVSTNRVFRVVLDSGRNLFAKVSSYGSYVHFRQDHARIEQWVELLAGTAYARFLARVLCLGGEVFTYESGGVWVVFYEEAHRRGVLPRVLSERQVENLGREMARFHLACAALAPRLHPTWQSLGSDVASLYDQMQSSGFCAQRGIDAEHARLVRRHCDAFFSSAERLGYHTMHKLPVLIDWNRGNFSVAYDEHGFRLYSRWDYDWFRIEPRALDFYFFSRVVREEGDQTVFSYTVSPLFEPRFVLFLRAYHGIYPLSEQEVRFIGESYRFFLLNYVLRTGEHFFLPDIHRRLSVEAIQRYLPELERADFGQLWSAIHA
jgi:Ser/Thr protein kinase RdoA (MazF antagonist)